MTLSFAPERIEQWPLERLKPYARNAKTHGADQVAKIAGSMAQFGWTVPVLVAGDGEVIAGHGRILAATQLGLTEAPVIVLDHLTEAQRRAYRIADNKLTELGAWDEALLAGELQELLAEDFDLSVVGFSDAELDELLAGDGDADGTRDGEDEVPETPVDPVSRPGDLWLLGPHRLLCGDATVATDVERVLGGVSPLLMVSDPPYGVEYDPSLAEQGRRGVDPAHRQGAERRPRRLARGLGALPRRRRLRLARRAARHDRRREPGGRRLRHPLARSSGRRSGWCSAAATTTGSTNRAGTPCKKTGKGHWAGDRKQTTLWQISSRDQDAETVHGTQKPVECMRRPILNNSSPGQAVYEPFMGSGTTLIAAETTGRVCLGDRAQPGLRRRRRRALAAVHRQGGGARRLAARASAISRPLESVSRHSLRAERSLAALLIVSEGPMRVLVACEFSGWSGTPSACEGIKTR